MQGLLHRFQKSEIDILILRLSLLLYMQLLGCLNGLILRWKHSSR
ncbi:Uncharacterised protein [Actinobacillus equuli]|nr:Uncharacterised protein [Actinobacillus equuli]